jgi:hypothetical protein
MILAPRLESRRNAGQSPRILRQRGAQGQSAPSLLACRQMPAPSRAAGGPRRVSLPRTQNGPHHRPLHAGTRLPQIRPLEAHVDFGPQAQGGLNMRLRWRARREGTANDPDSPKVHRYEGKLTTVQIKPFVFTLLLYTTAELGRRRPTTRF